MSRPSRSRTNPAAANAFRRFCTESVHDKLCRYATGRLGLAPIDAHVAGVTEATEAVDALFAEGLGGKLPWDLPEDATSAQAVGYLCQRLSWMHATSFRQRARAVHDEDLDERPDPGPDAFVRLSEERALYDLRRALAHDAQASAYLPRMRGGMTRGQIAEELGVTVEDANRIYKRIERRVAALHAAMNDNGAGARTARRPAEADRVRRGRTL